MTDSINTIDTNASDLAGAQYSTPQEDYDIFMSLDDLVIETVAPKTDEEDVEVEGDPTEFQESFEDDIDGSGVSNTEAEVEDADDELLTDEELEIELNTVNESQEKFAQSFSELPDDLSFTIGETEMTKSDINKMVQHKELTSQQAEVFRGHSERFEALNTAITANMAAAQTETSRQLQFVNQQLNNPAITGEHKLKLYSDKQILESREVELSQVAIEAANTMSQRKIEAEQANLANVSSALSQTYSDEAIVSVVGYANEMGISNEELTQKASIPLFEVLMKAQRYDETLKKSKARIKQKTSTVKSITSGKKKAPRVNSGTKREAIAKKWQKGEISNVDIFNSLTD